MVLTFQAYSKDQILSILQQRLMVVCIFPLFSLECLPFFYALIFLVLYFKAILSFAMASFLCILAHIYEVV